MKFRHALYALVAGTMLATPALAVDLAIVSGSTGNCNPSRSASSNSDRRRAETFLASASSRGKRPWLAICPCWSV